MLKEKRVDTLRPGNVFREWLIDVLNDRIRNKRCDVAVYKSIRQHPRLQIWFLGESYSVVAKFPDDWTGKEITIPLNPP